MQKDIFQRYLLRALTLCHQGKCVTVGELNAKLDTILEKWLRFEPTIQKIALIETNIDTISIKLGDIENKSKQNEQKIISLESSLNFANEDIKDMKKDIDTLKQEVSRGAENTSSIQPPSLSCYERQKLENEIIKLQEYSQRHNLIFEGIYENKGENCVHKIDALIRAHLHLTGAFKVIDKAHRLGTFKPGMRKPRPIIVRFISHQAKEKTFSLRRHLGGTGVWMKENLPEKVERENSLLNKVLNLAAKRDSNARVLRNRLYYNGSYYTVQTVKNTDLPIKDLHQKENENAICFQGQLSPLSNFFESQMTINNEQYCCVEQYYQSQKAKRNKDTSTFQEIMNSRDPVEIKRLSKKITSNRSVDDEKDENIKVMKQGLEAKFKAPNLKAYLILTGSKVLIESSKYDKFWGSGVGLHDRDCFDRAKIVGANNLGKLIQSVRIGLMNDA